VPELSGPWHTGINGQLLRGWRVERAPQRYVRDRRAPHIASAISASSRS